MELAEILDCPQCRDGFGLVAFVRESENRRVLRGHLGCPICEVEYPIIDGVIWIDATGAGRPLRPGAPAAHADPELSLRLAALLGLAERPRPLVLLGPGLGRHGAPLARLATGAEAIAWLDPVDEEPPARGVGELARGVNPIRGADRGRWPVRSSSLHGIALSEPWADMVEEAARCSRTGGRIVLPSPDSAMVAMLADVGFIELASDPGTWVGERC
jgi:uncharacterized protein YbaR (Trm112 family)